MNYININALNNIPHCLHDAANDHYQRTVLEFRTTANKK